jgi:hypothetical protein
MLVLQGPRQEHKHPHLCENLSRGVLVTLTGIDSCIPKGLIYNSKEWHQFIRQTTPDSWKKHLENKWQLHFRENRHKTTPCPHVTGTKEGISSPFHRLWHERSRLVSLVNVQDEWPQGVGQEPSVMVTVLSAVLLEGGWTFWLADPGPDFQKDNVSLSPGALQGIYWKNVFWKACKYSIASLSLLPWNDNEPWKECNPIFRWQH